MIGAGMAFEVDRSSMANKSNSQVGIRASVSYSF
jgi:hypothetical protein